jgi:hypothetical protein
MKRLASIGSHLPPPRAFIVGSSGISTASLIVGSSGTSTAPVPAVSVSAATQILDRAYGRPVQSIDVSEDGPTVRYIVELPEKSATTEEWLESIRREDAGRALVTGVAAAVDGEQTH